MPQSIRAMTRGLLLVMFFLSAPLVFAPLANAANLLVFPLRIDLAPGQTSAVLTLQNRDSAPVVVQLETVAWSQEKGKDVYAPSRDLVATPPVFTIPAGGTQLIRIGLRRPADLNSEKSFRLFLQEVPGARPQSDGVTLNMAMRIGVPIFMQPQAVVRKLDWQAQRLADGRLRVSVVNTGNVSEQFSALELLIPGADKPLTLEASMVYALAGQTHEWLVTPKGKLPAGVSSLRLKGRSNSGVVDQDVPLSAP
jgi:fimbrial chaperone protein